MVYKLNIAAAAEDDIRQAFLWYEEQKVKLGSTFEEHISKALVSIKENPLKTQIHYGSTRVFFIKKFPYGIHFIVSGDHILILAVFHTSRKPESWHERK